MLKLLKRLCVTAVVLFVAKKEEGPSQDGDYTILTRPLFFL